MAKKEYGDNVQVEIKGNKMLIEIDLTKELGLSKSEKNMGVGTTRGSARIYDDKNNLFIVGLNCYKPRS